MKSGATPAFETELLPFDTESIAKVAKLLTANEVVALPTETVYGLAGNAFETVSVGKIFKAKERPSFDPLIVHFSDRYLKDSKGTLPALVLDGILAPEILAAHELPKIQALIKQFWPGPLTLILPRGTKIPDAVTSSQPTVGIRCPAHPVFQAVLAKIPFPLAAPSANRFGRISPTEASHVMSELDGRIPAVIDGGSAEIGVESTILKIDFPFQATLLRPGKISIDELAQTLNAKIQSGFTLGESHQKKHEVTPGSLDEHYAPRKPLYLLPHAFSDLEHSKQFIDSHNLKSKLAFLAMHTLPHELKPHAIKTIVLSPSGEMTQMAHELFKSLRMLDEDPNVEVILADLPMNPSSGIGAAIADRLRRASRNKPTLT